MMTNEEFNKLDLFVAGEECRFDLEEALNKYGPDYVATKKSIMLDLSRGSDFHLACLLRIPDAGWNDHFDPNEPNGPFANKFRLLVTRRIQHLCQERNTPIGMEGTVPLSSRGEKMKL